jgi:acyl carrier protein
MKTRQAVRQAVFDCVAETFEFQVENLTEAMSAGDIEGWDSISTSYVVLNIEEKFDIELDVDRLLASESLGELIDYLTTYLSEKA